jgi:hypothetical protein
MLTPAQKSYVKRPVKQCLLTENINASKQSKGEKHMKPLRHLRVNGDQFAWRAKLVEDYNIDDRHHKNAMLALIEDIKQLAVVRDCYIDRETISKLYDRHISYQEKINA